MICALSYLFHIVMINLCETGWVAMQADIPCMEHVHMFVFVHAATHISKF